MKKKMSILYFLLIGILCLTACGGGGDKGGASAGGDKGATTGSENKKETKKFYLSGEKYTYYDENGEELGEEETTYDEHHLSLSYIYKSADFSNENQYTYEMDEAGNKVKMTTVSKGNDGSETTSEYTIENTLDGEGNLVKCVITREPDASGASSTDIYEYKDGELKKLTQIIPGEYTTVVEYVKNQMSVYDRKDENGGLNYSVFTYDKYGILTERITKSNSFGQTEVKEHKTEYDVTHEFYEDGTIKTATVVNKNDAESKTVYTFDEYGNMLGEESTYAGAVQSKTVYTYKELVK